MIVLFINSDISDAPSPPATAPRYGSVVGRDRQLPRLVRTRRRERVDGRAHTVGSLVLGVGGRHLLEIRGGMFRFNLYKSG